MIPPLSKEIVEKIREEVKKGKTKCSVAEELGVCIDSVYKYTKDIPRRKFWPDETKSKIREMVRELGSKSMVSRELDVPYRLVLRVAKDIKVGKGNHALGGKSLSMLQELLEKGYVLLEDRESTKYQVLKKHFPVIQKVRTNHKSIAFLPNRKEDATMAFLQSMNKRVMSYRELSSITKLFDVKLPRGEKKRFVGRSQNKRRGYDRGIESDLLLKSSDSLVDFTFGTTDHEISFIILMR